MGLPVPERIERLSRPRHPASGCSSGRCRRRRACSAASPTWATTGSATCTPRRTSRCAAGSCARSPSEREQSNFGTLLDIVIADDLRTVLWPVPKDDDGSSWELRREVWNDPRALLGGSDAGAHLDRMCGAPYTTRFLADCLRGRQLVSLERAVQLITSAPASLFGLRDRGVLREGAIADVVVFDPATIGLRRRHARRATCPATPPASPPARRASCGCSSTACRSSKRAGHRRDAGHGAALGARHRNRHRPLIDTGAVDARRTDARRRPVRPTDVGLRGGTSPRSPRPRWCRRPRSTCGAFAAEPSPTRRSSISSTWSSVAA